MKHINTARAADMLAASVWARKFDKRGGVPFSMMIGGIPFAEIEKNAVFTRETGRIDDARDFVNLTWIDASSSLRIRCAAVIYRDFPTVEWTVYIKNTGTADSPLIESVKAIDADLDGRCRLHYNLGDTCKADAYAPSTELIRIGKTKEFAPTRGRPSADGAFPYFGIQTGGYGVMMSIGWAGQWSADFHQTDRGHFHVTGGQQLTHFVLRPGEEARSPLMAMLFYHGSDFDRGVNLWRRWMNKHNSPFKSGEPQPVYSFCACPFMPGLKSNAAYEMACVDEIIRQDAKPDYWWLDAGWYPCGADWNEPGTWWPDPERYPRGIRELSDYLHARGIKQILWCEPERVNGISWLARNHPEWLHGPLLDLGNKDAWNWTVEHFDNLISTEGVDLYRQDFGMHPLKWYREGEDEDRQGLRENFHVQGYYSYWDELLKRHPGLIIDSCASGGRRNDIETLRRAVPLLRTDYQTFDGDIFMSDGNQGHTYGLSQWLPYYGHGAYYNNSHFAYTVRSYLSPAMTIPVDVRRDDIDWDLYHKVNNEYKSVAPIMLKDYYPLTTYSIADDKWLAMQFDRPEEGDGFLMAFRRAKCDENTLSIRPKAFARNAFYEFEDSDTGEKWIEAGKNVSANGMAVIIGDAPGSRLIKYRRTEGNRRT